MITLKFDNSLTIPPIEVPLYSDSPAIDPQCGQADSPRQTVMMGVMTPLLKLNNFVIIWDDVRYFKLYHADGLPQVHCVIHDTQGFIVKFLINSLTQTRTTDGSVFINNNG